MLVEKERFSGFAKMADFEKLNCLPARIYNRSRNIQLTKLAPFSPNLRYWLFLCPPEAVSFKV
jgi:hypothetical protein